MRKNYTIKVRLHSYIAHPYWPERERLITIIKESGMSRARSTANRRKALEEYLKSAGMTFAQFEELERKAEEPFYRAGQRIVVPELHVTSMIVATCDTIRAAGRPVPPDQVRSALRAGDWMTDRVKPDGVWERFVVVTAGTGAKLSNQRALRSNPYIGSPPGSGDEAKPVPCTGVITLDESMVKPAVLLDALRWAGTDIGIGASRKMGWGRFDVLSLD
jgi:hypothetical protein